MFCVLDSYYFDSFDAFYFVRNSKGQVFDRVCLSDPDRLRNNLTRVVL